MALRPLYLVAPQLDTLSVQRQHAPTFIVLQHSFCHEFLVDHARVCRAYGTRIVLSVAMGLVLCALAIFAIVLTITQVAC